jgi:hypothetical protein
MRFTIRGLMIAVAIMAGLLALPGGLSVLGAALCFTALALYTAWRLQTRGQRRLVGFCFGSLALLTNVSYTALCIAPEFARLVLLFLVWLLVLGPSLSEFGIAWANLVARQISASPRPNGTAWLLVFALTIIPAVTVLTVWPLRLGFLMARPALESLADQVAAGQPVPGPRWVGPFRVARLKVDSGTGNVGLMIYPYPNGPVGLVRDGGRGSRPPRCYSPFRGDWLDLRLGYGWCYHDED